MVLAPSLQPQHMTPHLGGLSAIQHAGIRLAICNRRLTRPVRRQLAAVALEAPEINFVSVTAEPFEHVRGQLADRGIETHFLVHDVALLVAIFGELTRAERVRVSLSERPSEPSDIRDKLRLFCSYQECFQESGGRRSWRLEGRRRRYPAGFVAVYRTSLGEEPQAVREASGLCLYLDEISAPALGPSLV